MSSKIEICNRALIRLGASPLTSLTEDSKEARLCVATYDLARKELLRSHPFNFAIKRVTLASLVQEPAFEYTYKYLLPTDCLRVLKIYNSANPFKVENGYIVTDEPELNLIYISDVTDPNKFDAMFSSLLTLGIAKDIGYTLTENASLIGILNEEFIRLKREAKLFDGQEGSPDQFDQGDWLDSRY